ncbi:helix-turn-helix domain-containing protein [Terasakiella pusilla]|uniref:helix-turn-helix domain-containing protein n=1 Tax=Terasakiella pusilla TaxID=64973 RepID=UPI00056E7572|nr:helix-turn-helix domain-containing protein [Terasakiella pusilla]
MIISDPADIGRLIKEKRITMGLRLEDVHLATGIAMSTLSKIENSPGTKRLENILAILNVLDIQLIAESK